jgi:hypothetical protein
MADHFVQHDPAKVVLFHQQRLQSLAKANGEALEAESYSKDI